MPTLQRLTALALARAMLAGPPDADGLAARMRHCLGIAADAATDATGAANAAAQHAWCSTLAALVAAWPSSTWQRLDVRSLATLVQQDNGYQQAWRGGRRLHVRNHLLPEPPPMRPAPAALQACALPAIPHAAALAAWLQIPAAGLWRLVRSSGWQRRGPLVQQHYRYQLLAKRSGGWRLLEVPQPHLLALQRRVLARLLDAVPPHGAACGFRRGLSVVDHARAHAGQPVLLRFDLRDFFTSVHASRVHALFTTLGYPDSVARDLTALCTTATPEPVLRRLHDEGRSGGLPWQQLQRLRDAHLPQGAPTSPALANLCAFRLDLRLAGLAQRLQAQYTRYADDVVLSGAAHLRSAMPRIAAWVSAIAHDEDFAVNHRKTRCQTAAQQQSVCGIVVNQHTNLPRAEFDRLKAVLHLCLRDGPAAHNREGLADWRSHLQGRVAWAAQLNPAKALRLQRLLAQIDWRA